MILQQIERERSMVQAGIEAYRRDLDKASSAGTEDTTGGVQAIMRRAVVPLTDGLQAWLDDSATRTAGRRATAAKLLVDIPASHASFITLREVMSAIRMDRRMVATASSIGQRIEDEIRYAKFVDVQPKLFKKIAQDARSRSRHRDHIRRDLISQCNRHGVENTGWTKEQRLRVGHVLLELCVKHTGLIKLDIYQSRKTRKDTVIRATEAAFNALQDAHEAYELLRPKFTPMLAKPAHWTTLRDGGYLSDLPQVRLPFLKTRNMAFLKQLETYAHEGGLSAVMEAVNSLQDTAWSVNERLLDVLAELWDNDYSVAGLPTQEATPLPPRLSEEDAEDTELFIEHKRHRARIYLENTRRFSRVLAVTSLLDQAQHLRGAAFYFPYQLDFRGRIYAVPSGLTPQGDDAAKALLQFSEGKAIETHEDVAFLAVSGAGLFGHDKVSFADRVQWVEDHQSLIRDAVENPMDSTWWTMADKPFQFLAWCIEWCNLLDHGLGYVSHVPCQVDGSCNGLQNFAAMLRDSVSGAEVNLVPGDIPRDIYQRVAEKAVELLEANDDDLARQWLDYGLDRKMVKRPVMVLPYGGTRHSCREYLAEHVTDMDKDAYGKASPWTEQKDLFEATQYLANVVWAAINEIVVAARQVMSWLQKLASLANKAGRPICWQAPSGFVVFQRYADMEARKIKLHFPESLQPQKRGTLRFEADGIDKRRMASAISPNFVHSLDAAHLTATVNAFDGSLGAIHDAYLVHATDIPKLGQAIRATFVEMYSTNDVLADMQDAVASSLPDGVKIPPAPAFGDLDLQDVLNSEFFFA